MGSRMKLYVILLCLLLFAFCKRAEGASPEAVNAAAPAAGASWTEPRTGMVFRWVPAGCFLMGSPKSEQGRNVDEGPQHKVCLSGFWIGEKEVTQAQWTTLMKSNPSLIKSGDDYPVDMISWNMAKGYAAAMSRGGENFRLPTEAEWEYACRAGTTTPYAFGDSISRDQASFDKRFSLPAEPLTPRRASRRKKHSRIKLHAPRIWPNMHTNVTASFPANAFGLYDMHGNVWEWCEDVYDAAYYSRSRRDNPRNDGQGKSRVLRGGSWVTKAEALRSANRGKGWPDMPTAFYGLRLVRTAPPLPVPAARPKAAVSSDSAPSANPAASTLPSSGAPALEAASPRF
jgi:formylglycine-generating enzyme